MDNYRQDKKSRLWLPESKPVCNLTGPMFFGAGPAAASYLLDTYTGAAEAYSFARKLRAAQTNAIRTRDSADSNPINIGFVADATDTATILSSYGAEAWIEAVYDQVTNGANFLYQTASGNRPRVYTSSTLQLINTRLVATVYGGHWVDSNITVPSWGTTYGVNGDAAYSVFAVHRKTTATGGCLYGWGDTAVALAATGYYDDNTTAQLHFAGPNGYKTSVPTNNTLYLTSIIKTAGAIDSTTTIRRNGVSVATSGHSVNTPNVDGTKALYWGQWANHVSNMFIGQIAELVIWPFDQTSNLAGIESNMMNYYGI